MDTRLAALLLAALAAAPAAWGQADGSSTEAPSAATKSLPAQGEVVVGIGLLSLAGDIDVQLSYRLGGSPWEFGYRHLRTKETADDPFTGNLLTKTVETISGPFVNYRFPSAPDAWWYAGVGIYEWKKSHASSVAGRLGEDSTTTPFIGGGYAGSFGGIGRFNLGLYVSPFAELETGATARIDEDEIGVDLVLQLGLGF